MAVEAGLANQPKLPLDPSLTTLQWAYNAGKAAATHIATMFATELARRNIPVRVNSLAPGVFMSELTRSRLEKGLDSMKQLGLHPVPAGRIGR